MKIVTIHETKAHLSRLEEIIIANHNVSMMQLKVVRKEQNARRFGGLRSLVTAMSFSFDEPLTDFAEYQPSNDGIFTAVSESAE